MRIGVEGGAERVRILVEDAGPGVPGAEKERIFERFARGSAARHRVGTGLGLALVAEHARLHGGRAWVEDRPGRRLALRHRAPRRPRMRAWPGVAAGVLVLAGLTLASCGLPTDDAYRPIDPDALGALAETTTTSTTTTSTLPPQTTTTIEPTTTSLPTTEPVTVYFVDGNQQLAPVDAGGHDPGVARQGPSAAAGRRRCPPTLPACAPRSPRAPCSA